MREDYSIRATLTVRYADLDGQSIVFYGNYLTYVDVAINNFIRESGIDYPRWAKESGLDFNVVKASIEYHSPLQEDDVLAIGVRLERMGRSSITWKVAIFRGAEAGPAATAEVIWVCANQTTYKSQLIPDTIRSAFLALGQHD